MYQFTTTSIINSAKDSNTDIDKFVGTIDALTVARVGKFKKAGILSIHKRSFYAGVKEKKKITVPAVTAGLVLRVELDIRLYDQTYSDYADTHMYFKKAEFVEVIAANNGTTDALKLANQLNDLKDRFGYSYVKATVNGAELIIEATDVNQEIYAITILKEVANPSSITTPAYESVGTSFTLVTQGKPGFGDDNWMARKIMLPTAENSRYFGYNKEERPILGGQYTQYTLRYSIEKDGEDGTVAGGKSVTTHVFYVLSSLVAAFEAAIIELAVVLETVGVVVTDVTLTSGALDISEVTGTDDFQITYTTTPAGVTGAVFTLNTALSTVAGTADWTKVTLSTNGMFAIAADHGLAAADKIAVNVAIDGTTLVKEITLG